MLIIPLADKFADGVLRGHKTSTVRRGYRPYAIGPCILRTDSQDILVWVTCIRHCLLSELTEYDAQQDGFESLSELYKELERIYSDFKPEEEVTVVSFIVDIK